MANYSVNLTDNGNGSYAVTTVLRAPSTPASGGTSINVAWNGTTGFLETHETNTWLNLGDAIERAKIVILNDHVSN